MPARFPSQPSLIRFGNNWPILVSLDATQFRFVWLFSGKTTDKE